MNTKRKRKARRKKEKSIIVYMSNGWNEDLKLNYEYYHKLPIYISKKEWFRYEQVSSVSHEPIKCRLTIEELT